MSSKTYLRIIFSSESEIPFIKMNIRESLGCVDSVIIYEANRTHTGNSREFIFEGLKHLLPDNFLDRVLYIADDVSDVVVASTLGDVMHENERLFRSRFARYVPLNHNDIVIAVDADEVIRKQVYKLIFKKLRDYPVWRLPLHQFFYRMNYLWKDMIFTGPNVCVASYYLNQSEPKWRDEGRLFPVICGNHFSWQLTVDQMLHKLKTYAHADLYGHLAKKEILEAAIREKTYPFEPGRPFVIEELDVEKDAVYYPNSFYEFIDDFEMLLS